jgi:division protein CdvB (Snf7/Vps24/ESCRT-III family)
MKVKITKRVVFHKIADITIDVPDNISKFEMDEWLLMNENEWIFKVDRKLGFVEDEVNEVQKVSEAEFGFGLGDGMVDEDAEVEERFDILDDNGKPIYGGHI